MLQYQVEDFSPLFDMSRGDRILKERLGMDRVYMLDAASGTGPAAGAEGFR